MDVSAAVLLFSGVLFVLLIAAGAFAVMMKIAEHRRNIRLASLMRRIVKILSFFAVLSWIFAGLTMFAAMSQSNH